jgi:hypothetical protein
VPSSLIVPWAGLVGTDLSQSRGLFKQVVARGFCTLAQLSSILPSFKAPLLSRVGLRLGNEYGDCREYGPHRAPPSIHNRIWRGICSLPLKRFCGSDRCIAPAALFPLASARVACRPSALRAHRQRPGVAPPDLSRMTCSSADKLSRTVNRSPGPAASRFPPSERGPPERALPSPPQTRFSRCECSIGVIEQWVQAGELAEEADQAGWRAAEEEETIVSVLSVGLGYRCSPRRCTTR